MSRRTDRLNEQFKRELMEILRNEVRDPRLDDLTVTRVTVAPDLQYARVLLTSLRPESGRAEILDGLNAAGPFIRGALGRRLTIRRVPELDFRWDETLDHARRIEQLLSEVLPRDGTGHGEREADGPEHPGNGDDG